MPKIFLVPEVMSGLGEDTFWTWFARETGAEFALPNKLGAEDIVLHYSTVGRPAFPGQSISLLWELYPEMALRLGKSFYRRSRLVRLSESARWATCATHYSRAFYSKETVVIPIGVNTDLFSPATDKAGVRRELGWDINGKYAIWVGAHHPMKGPDLRDAWAQSHPDWNVVTVQKETPINQEQLAKMMSTCDGFLNTSRLVPMYMFEWECLASGLPMIEAGGIQREHEPENPREFVFEMGWSRTQSLQTWMSFIDKCRFELRKTS
jgi:hypothetical protein